MSGLLHGVTEARFSCMLTRRVWVDQQDKRLGVESPICEWSPLGLPTTHWEVPSLDSAPHSFCATSEKLHLKTQNLHVHVHQPGGFSEVPSASESMMSWTTEAWTPMSLRH